METQEKPEMSGESVSPGSENVSDGFANLLNDANRREPVSEKPEKRTARKGKRKAVRKQKSSRPDPSGPESGSLDSPAEIPVSLDFNFLRTLARIPFSVAGMVTGKTLSLTDPEAETVAVALAPVAEKHFPALAGSMGAELNLAATCGVILIDKLGVLNPKEPEPEAEPVQMRPEAAIPRGLSLRESVLGV